MRLNRQVSNPQEVQTMAIPARLKAHFEQTHTAYFPVTHAPARSAQYAASLLHVPGKELAKTVALRAGDKALLAVLPASYHINLDKLASVVGVGVKLMKEEECLRLFPDCQPGAIPPFGELYGLPVYLDRSLVEDPEIIFNAGTLSNGVRMGNTDFVHLAKPRICSFAERGEARTRRGMEGCDTPDEGGGK
jgi:Ala-tRNA(Pro) deacylase